MARSLCLLTLILAATLTLAQTEFSAEIVDLHKPGTPSRIYFAKDKVRVEPNTGGPMGVSVVIINFATQTSTVVMAQQHMYMEMPAQSQNSRIAYGNAFFRTTDVENACGDWQKMTHNQGSCHKVGNQTVNGRSTVEYEGTRANGDVSHVWIDPKLRFPVKWDGKDAGGELRNIQEGSQPASLFEIPAGFTKMEMPGGMTPER
jgi:hypothetical protein